MAGDPRIRGEHYLLVQPAPEAADHPRIRGEHESSTSRSRPSPGSSPHTRGAPRDVPPENIDIGIIPAYAGSTGSCPPARHSREDHPRIRGEHLTMRNALSTAPGSSPHTRGAPISTRASFNLSGIIPAYAGSTELLCPPPPAPTDHPRIRGEHLKLRTNMK